MIMPTLFATASPDRRRLPGGTNQPLLELEELSGLAEDGVEVGAHSASHVDLTRLDDPDLEVEIAGSRRTLERYCGREVETFAYPFGRHDARVRAVAERFFNSAWTTRLATLEAQSDPFALPRLDAYYLGSSVLRRLLAIGHPQPYLRARGWLRRLRGTEPRIS